MFEAGLLVAILEINCYILDCVSKIATEMFLSSVYNAVFFISFLSFIHSFSFFLSFFLLTFFNPGPGLQTFASVFLLVIGDLNKNDNFALKYHHVHEISFSCFRSTQLLWILFAWFCLIVKSLLLHYSIPVSGAFCLF